jgi:predicted amidohydrolase
MPKTLKAAVLQMDNLIPYQKNLDNLLAHIDRLDDCDIILAPEICLTDYDYDNIEEACRFGEGALEQLCEVVDNQLVGLTVLTRHEDGSYTNDAVLIHNHKIVHRQSKHKLFLLGEEDRHLQAGSEDGFELFEIDGVKYGMMICFELRFKDIWKRLEGADVILVPSQWGLPRKRHLEILAPALAVMNQAYVLVANSSKADMARSSTICSPDGDVARDDKREVVSATIDLGLIRKMRRYIVMK